MPSYFLTVRLPLFQLGGDSLEWVDKPGVTYEKQAHVFYETDQKAVAESILKLFLPNHPDSCFHGDFKIVNGSNVDSEQRVFYRHEVRELEQIGSVNDWADAIRSHGPRKPFLVRLNEQARKLEPIVRDDLGLAEKGGQQHSSPEKPAETDSDVEPAKPQPKDLMTTAVAVSKFHVSRSTLQRMLKEGKLKSYRRENAAPNAAHQYSQKELARYCEPMN